MSATQYMSQTKIILKNKETQWTWWYFSCYGTQRYVAYSCLGMTKITLLHPCGKDASHITRKWSLDSVSGMRSSFLCHPETWTRPGGPWSLLTTHLWCKTRCALSLSTPGSERKGSEKQKVRSITEEWKTVSDNKPETRGLRVTWRHGPLPAFYLRTPG